MNIQFGSLFFLQERFLAPLKEKISFNLTNRQKAVMMVAFLALVLIAASCRLLGRYCDFRASNIPDDDEEESLSEGISLDLETNTYPNEVFTEVFKRLDLEAWRAFGKTNRHLNEIYKAPEVLGAVLDVNVIPSHQRLKLAKQFKGYLKKLSFHGIPKTAHKLQKIFQACPNIVDLDLSFLSHSASQSSDLTAADLAHLLPLKLNSLKLCYWDKKLTDLDLIQLARSQPSLKILDLRECLLVTNKGIKQFQQLESLTLTSNEGIKIAKLPRSLLSLNLIDFQLTTEDIKQLPEGLQSLTLNLSRYSR